MFLVTYIPDYKMYHHYDDDEPIDNSIENVKKITLIHNILITIIVLTLIIGLIRSTYKRKLDHVDSKWNWYKYWMH